MRFQYPDEPFGTDPDRLLANMNETLAPLEEDSSRTIGGYFGDMLALAERITDIHLGPDFLDRPGLTLGDLNDYDN